MLNGDKQDFWLTIQDEIIGCWVDELGCFMAHIIIMFGFNLDKL